MNNKIKEALMTCSGSWGLHVLGLREHMHTFFPPKHFQPPNLGIGIVDPGLRMLLG